MFRIELNIDEQRAEDEICERTLCRLQEYAKAMNITVEKALEDVIPDTRKRLVAYMARKASPAPTPWLSGEALDRATNPNA